MHNAFVATLALAFAALTAAATPIIAAEPSPVPWQPASPEASASPALAPAEPELFRFFAETGHNLGPPFRAFYDANGALARFGYPLSEAFAAPDGTLTQYFERARLEARPGPSPQVTIADLGSELSADREGPAFWHQPTPSAEPQRALPDEQGVRYFATTGHTLRGDFRAFWEASGGLLSFGAPISELLVRWDEQRGQATIEQYFERARLELHPDPAGRPAAVQLGLLGREQLERAPLAPEALAPAAPITRLAEAATPYSPNSADATNILLAAQRLDGLVVQPGATLSFLGSMGELSEQAGFVTGAAIVDGEIQPVLAGGICQVSSALYEAALRAGLEIVERHNHSLLLGFFAGQPGLEAAVFSPGQDLRLRNDTAHPIVVDVGADPQAGLITLALWGVADGRVSTLQTASSVEIAPEPAAWVLDAALPPGAALEIQPAAPGLEVAITRAVLAADGSLLREDQFTSSYAALRAEVRHGPGVQAPNEDGEACLVVDAVPADAVAIAAAQATLFQAGLLRAGQPPQALALSACVDAAPAAEPLAENQPSPTPEATPAPAWVPAP
jgi:hypothetical protein